MKLLPAFCLLFACSALLGAEKRVALVIGNSAYQEKRDRLPNAVADAKAVATMLKEKLGFTLVELGNGKPTRNLGKAETFVAIEALANAGKSADIVLLYYAGHGMEEIDGTENYLMPVDADIGAADAKNSALRAFGVPLSDVIKDLPESSSRIVLLDCCRTRPKARGATGAEGDGLNAPNVEELPKDTLVMLAAAPRKAASDGEGRNGPFALALLKHLPQPSSDMRRTFSNVRKEVVSLTQSAQNPWLKLDAGGDFFFENALVPLATLKPPSPTPPASVTESKPEAKPAPVTTSSVKPQAVAAVVPQSMPTTDPGRTVPPSTGRWKEFPVFEERLNLQLRFSSSLAERCRILADEDPDIRKMRRRMWIQYVNDDLEGTQTDWKLFLFEMYLAHFKSAASLSQEIRSKLETNAGDVTAIQPFLEAHGLRVDIAHPVDRPLVKTESVAQDCNLKAANFVLSFVDDSLRTKALGERVDDSWLQSVGSVARSTWSKLLSVSLEKVSSRKLSLNEALLELESIIQEGDDSMISQWNAKRPVLLSQNQQIVRILEIQKSIWSSMPVAPPFASEQTLAKRIADAFSKPSDIELQLRGIEEYGTMRPQEIGSGSVMAQALRARLEKLK